MWSPTVLENEGSDEDLTSVLRHKILTSIQASTRFLCIVFFGRS